MAAQGTSVAETDMPAINQGFMISLPDHLSSGEEERA